MEKRSNLCHVCGLRVVPDKHYTMGPMWFINCAPLTVNGVCGEIYGHRECLDPLNDLVIHARIMQVMDAGLRRTTRPAVRA